MDSNGVSDNPTRDDELTINLGLFLQHNVNRLLMFLGNYKAQLHLLGFLKMTLKHSVPLLGEKLLERSWRNVFQDMETNKDTSYYQTSYNKRFIGDITGFKGVSVH